MISTWPTTCHDVLNPNGAVGVGVIHSSFMAFTFEPRRLGKYFNNVSDTERNAQ